MKTHHTPGPWETARSLSGKLFVTITHKIGMARKQVCEVLPNIYSGNYKANAALIAAAPDLLDACELALRDLDPLSDHLLIETLTAAITKATTFPTESTP